MRIETEPKLDFASVLIRPKISTLGSRSEVDISREYTFKWSRRKFEGIPIIAANMDTVGTIEMAAALEQYQCCAALHKHYTVQQLFTYFDKARPLSWYSMGILDADIAKFNEVRDLIQSNLRFAGSMDIPIHNICIDVANGYSTKFLDFVKRFREDNPHVTIMAGNVVTADITEQLILAGVDIVKVGIGPGSACTTRKMTGVGYPQLSAVIECADAAHGLKGFICSDGGCTVPGDLAKAFGGGADFVMLGGMLAAHKEVVGDKVSDKIEFYGMSSKTAQEKHNGGVAEYRASEGKRVMIPYRGPVEGTIKEILGGLRSSCTYVGAHSLKELSKRTTFVIVNSQRNQVFDQYDA